MSFAKCAFDNGDFLYKKDFIEHLVEFHKGKLDDYYTRTDRGKNYFISRKRKMWSHRYTGQPDKPERDIATLYTEPKIQSFNMQMAKLENYVEGWYEKILDEKTIFKGDYSIAMTRDDNELKDKMVVWMYGELLKTIEDCGIDVAIIYGDTTSILNKFVKNIQALQVGKAIRVMR